MLADCQGITEIDAVRKVEFRHHLLHVTNHEVRQEPLVPREHVAHLRGDDVLDLGFGKRRFQSFREVFNNDDGFGAAVL